MGKKRDILFLCQFFYPEYISSAQLPYDTVMALSKAGFSVDVLCGYPREYLDGGQIPKTEQLGDVTIRRLRYIQMDRSGFLGRLVNYFSFTMMVLLRLFTMGRYQAVVVYSNPPVLPWVASWAKALFGTKLVFVAYDLYPEVATVTGTLRQGNLICRLMEHINKCVYRRCDQVVSLSSEQQAYILTHRPVAAEKVRVIPNWDPERPEPPLAHAPDKKGTFLVSYFGNMGTMQDMQTILDAIRHLKDRQDIAFLFAGHGNKMDQLRQVVQDEGLSQVQIVPFLHGEAFQQALAASDCALVSLEKGATGLCVPSKTYCYMRHGIPLAAILDECDIVRDIQAGAGLWVRSGEGSRLAQELAALAQDPQRRAAMAETCRSLYTQRYSAQLGTEAYCELFRELLGPQERR